MDHSIRLRKIQQNTFALDVSDEQLANLDLYIDGFKCRNFGIEAEPEKYIYAKPCKWAKPKVKSDRSFPGGIKISGIPGGKIDSVWVAVFVRKFKRYPKPGYCVSHICGKKWSRCIEHTHFEVVPISENNGRTRCHRLIIKWERSVRFSKMPRRLRQGTIFEGTECKHKPTCFRQFGEF